MPAPRIYNLHPLLAGPIEGWAAHLERVAGMGFDWVYVNAFFEPGASGSIYAVRRTDELHPAVRGDATAPMADLVRGFTRAARGHGLRVMTDFMAAHRAREATLVEDEPDWFRRRHDGSLIPPMLANPEDPFRPRFMADLAEVDFDEAYRAGQVERFAAEAEALLGLGIDGLRCSTAYKAPPAFWRDLLGRLKAGHDGAVFLAATLGAPFEQVMALEGVGFDWVLDSSRWWNFHDDWYLEQAERLRRVGAPVAFPEEHNTGRLGHEAPSGDPKTIERLYRARYLASLGLGDGILMPMGFEYGSLKNLDPIRTRPEDWAEDARSPRIDLTAFIAAANRLKAGVPALQDGGLVRRVSAPNGRVLSLLRLDAGTPVAATSAALLLVNPDPARTDGVAAGPLLTAAGGRFADLADKTPEVEPFAIESGEPLTLDPWGVRLLVAESSDETPSAPDPAASEALLLKLAENRVAVERVTPELDGGRFPVKRVVGDVLEVEADIFSDGHDRLAACVRYRPAGEGGWREAPMAPVDNDRWAGRFALTKNTRYVYTVEAWRDVFASWRLEVTKKNDAGVAIGVELKEGRDLVARTAEKAMGADKAALDALVEELEGRTDDEGFQLARLLSTDVQALMRRADLRVNRSVYGRDLGVTVDRPAAANAAWYEIFPRSMSDDPKRHGTFDDVIAKLPYVRDMGFDVLYFPPIHPIGRTNRKGRNNSLKARAGDPGSPYAIGAEEGGHDALHPELGTFDDFARLIGAAADHGLEIAIDFAIQCSPDHPWIKTNPEWFDWRPDGTLKFAENPPKKYEDISNVAFYRGDEPIPSLWQELYRVVTFWCDKGVKTFRVDNPHTKPFPFWEWMIGEVQKSHPDAVFLAEAFTRPKVMKRLAKVGFTQSYSYFTWRDRKAEMAEYLTELTQEEAGEFMRPNFFVNTPDINPVFLQTSGRPGFLIRATLAATLSPVYGVYSGFELCEGTPVPGKEEYLDSEKYEVRAWDWDRPGNIRAEITRLNQIRRENPALQKFTNLSFLNAWNDTVLVYAKFTENLDNAVLVAVNMDPRNAQGCHFEVPLWRFGLADDATIGVEDLLSRQRFSWTGKAQHVWLDPHRNPVAVWRLIPPGIA
ncbi:MAG: DUF3416 domain-containing protein [Geminicoccaceae bacterium]|nr:DUF3416 domain-containing protein [Geminicoccaceae bacterium]